MSIQKAKLMIRPSGSGDHDSNSFLYWHMAWYVKETCTDTVVHVFFKEQLLRTV